MDVAMQSYSHNKFNAFSIAIKKFALSKMDNITTLIIIKIQYFTPALPRELSVPRK
jgi:hypothetical protein